MFQCTEFAVDVTFSLHVYKEGNVRKGWLFPCLGYCSLGWVGVFERSRLVAPKKGKWSAGYSSQTIQWTRQRGQDAAVCCASERGMLQGSPGCRYTDKLQQRREECFLKKTLRKVRPRDLDFRTR